MKFQTQIIFVILLIGPLPLTIHSTVAVENNPLPSITSDGLKGVLLIDDTHDNDYSTSMNQIYKSLTDDGFIVRFSSNFSSFSEALSFTNHLLISATYSGYTETDISAIKNWMESGARNLILASRGDFNKPDYSAMNSILGNVSASSRVQDDNIYTTDSSAWQPWYIDTNNFNSDFSEVFSGVDVMSFFSPSSVVPGDASVLVHAEAQAYQSDETGHPPSVIYDNVSDNTGGDAIPLATYETIGSGADSDRVAVFGTTMWSDFDYGDSGAQDTVMFENLLNYMVKATESAAGDIVISLPDSEPPTVSILFPRDGATLTGKVAIAADAKDAYGIGSISFKFDNEVVSDGLYFALDTAQVSEGEHTASVTVKDVNGNEATVTHTYYIDHNFKPTLRSVVKFMTYNIKESGIFKEWKDVVKEENPDVLILVETGNFDDSNNALLSEVQREFNTYFADEAPYSAYTLQGIDNAWNGISLLSRFKITTAEKLDSLKSDTGSTVNVPLPFLNSVIKVGDTPISVIGGHLTCCSDGKIARANEQEGILNFMDGLGDVPIIYMGDMNSESPVDTTTNGASDLGYEPIDMVINSSNPKASEIHSFTDVFRTLNPSENGSSFISSSSRIDFIFANQHLSSHLLNSTTGDTASANVGSDHYDVDAFIDLGSYTSDTLVDPFVPDITSISVLSSEHNDVTTAPKIPIEFIPVLLGLVVVTLKRRK